MEINRAFISYSLLLVLYNNIINLLPGQLHAKIYVFFNLFLLFLLLLFSRKYLHLDFADIGYKSENLLRSLFTGLLFACAILLPFLLVLVLLPVLGIRIRAPIVDVGTLPEFLYRIFIRIPLGTALFEESLFRGILYAYLIKKHSFKKTLLLTGIFFAIWHIVPAIKVMSSNFQFGLCIVGILMLGVGLIGAFLAGMYFAVLRRYSRDLYGCLLCHALVNDLSLVIILNFWK